MSHIAGFISCGILADAGDFFELIGPLFFFGIYILAALAKGWSKSNKQKAEEQLSPELKKAVQKRYHQIHDRQMGQTPSQVTPQKQIRPQEQSVQPEPVRPVQRAHSVLYPFQRKSQRHPMSPKIQQPRYVPEKPVAVKIEPPIFYSEHRKEKVSPVKASSRQPENTIIRMLRQPQNLRNAIILKEILDKPLALRDS